MHPSPWLRVFNFPETVIKQISGGAWQPSRRLLQGNYHKVICLRKEPDWVWILNDTGTFGLSKHCWLENVFSSLFLQLEWDGQG